jgi:NAD(P)-dependent dehydrogenase (short-subunit alcohol dehydrogenase family)
MQLANRICLIAGASGAIGMAVAQRFHSEGARLALTYQTRRPQSEKFLGSEDRAGILQIPLDIRRRKNTEEAAAQVITRFGGIDVLVNCTGILGPIGPTAQVSIDDWVEAVEINLLGSFYLTRAVLPTMLAQGRGKIIHFSGGGAAYARPFFTAYSASKAGLVRFTESLAEELKECGIDVNAIAPGPVNSRMWQQLRASAEAAGPQTAMDLKTMEETGGVAPELAATLALFLASDRANGLSGRLLSAVHDDWSRIDDKRIAEIMHGEAGTLRRVALG